MNIKEHIEQGHYPKDEKGRSLVSAGRWDPITYTIVCTDRPGNRPIMGFCATITNSFQCWDENGDCGSASLDLLPPPPRTVKVEAWAVVRRDGFSRFGIFWSQASAAIYENEELCVVPLTGELEKPWS